MPRKTDGEKIDELEKLVSTLVERIDYVRNEMIDRERLAVVEERLNELKRTIEEAARKRWSIWPALIGGVIGAVLGFLGQLAILLLKK